MAKQITAEALQKKFKTVSNTQDSIPMLSLWIIHHKQHHKLIADQWLEVLKKAKPNHRLTLVYLCNDVIQNCRRKNAPVFKEAFTEVLPEAVTHLRDSNIKNSVQRVIKIWSKRGVLEPEFTDQLIAALLTNKAPEKLRHKLLVEYKTTSLIDEIKQFKDLEDNIEIDQRRLQSIRVDVSSSDAIRKLKDKVGGEKFSKEFEESATQLQSLLGRFEKYVEKRKNLLEILEKGAVYYHAQYHEAQIVVNAYKSFEGRVMKMKRGLDKIKEKFPPSDDMEMSDEDNNELNTSIISVNPTLIEQPKTEKSNDNPTKLITENILKLLPTAINSLKSEESGKKEGAISRPGMRGASKNTKPEVDAAREVLTIVRSIQEAQSKSKKDKFDLPPSVGSESPPSPTGSPELNIASPPRHQSLESRLADLFSDGVNKDNSIADSDTESETNFPMKLKLIAEQKDNLPGLGDIQKQTPKIENKNANSKDTIKNGNVTLKQSDTTTPDLSTASSVNNQPNIIPVISGSTRISSVIDSSATPTLDETYQTSSASYSEQNLFLSPPRFTGDALGFLTNIMGQATNTELSSAQSTETQSTSVNSSDAIYDSWPPLTQKTEIPALGGDNLQQSWPSGSTVPDPQTVVTTSTTTPKPWDGLAPPLPPPPVFSWPDTTIEPPWHQQWPPSVSTTSTVKVNESLKSEDVFEPPVKRGKIEPRTGDNSSHIKPGSIGPRRRSSNLITLNPQSSPNAPSRRPVYPDDEFRPPVNNNFEQSYHRPDNRREPPRQDGPRHNFNDRNGHENSFHKYTDEFLPKNGHVGEFRGHRNPQPRPRFPNNFDKSFEPKFEPHHEKRGYPHSEPRQRFPRPNLPPPGSRDPIVRRSSYDEEQIDFELKLLEEERMRKSEMQMRGRPRHRMPPPRGWGRGGFSNPVRPRLHSPRMGGPPRPRHDMFSPRIRYR